MSDETTDSLTRTAEYLESVEWAPTLDPTDEELEGWALEGEAYPVDDEE